MHPQNQNILQDNHTAMLDPAGSHCPPDVCSELILCSRTELIHPHLIPHPHRDHNGVPYALQDVWPGLKAWAAVTEQSKA
jgi:hypothetical protein